MRPVAAFDDLTFAPPQTLQVLAGASPFRQRGNAYIADHPWLAQSVRGRFDRAFGQALYRMESSVTWG